MVMELTAKGRFLGHTLPDPNNTGIDNLNDCMVLESPCPHGNVKPNGIDDMNVDLLSKCEDRHVCVMQDRPNYLVPDRPFGFDPQSL